MEDSVASSLLSVLETEELRDALTQLAKVEEELSRRRREKGIDYFIPNKPQLQALRSPARIVAYCGGNRAGKSTAGSAFLAAHLTHNYRGCPCHGEWFAPNKRYKRSLSAVIVVTGFAKVDQMLEKKLFSLLPKDWIKKIKRTPQGYMSRIIGKDDSSIDILTSEMDTNAFESTDWDVAWIDEPTSHERFIGIQRGLTDRRGYTMLTFTPLVEPWMKDELVDKADGKLIDVVQADTYENLEDIHGNPILTREAVQELESVMSEEDRQTRIHGRFFHLKGIVYTEFTPSMHVQDFEYQYPDPVIAVLDPHDRLPHHILWAWVDQNDWVYIDSELVVNATVAEFRKMVTLHEQKKNYKMVKRLIDPNFGRKPLITTGRTVIQELAMAPFSLRFGEANDDVQAGHMKVKDYLHWNKGLPIGLTNSPKLFFHRFRVPKTLHSIQNYQYDEWRGKTVELRDPKEKQRPKDDHGADCLRYLCMSNPQFDRLLSVSKEYEMEEAPY